MKRQILHIGGGESSDNYSHYLEYVNSIELNLFEEKIQKWHKKYERYLGNDYEIIRHNPLDNSYSDYEVWKIMFEKLLPYVRDDIILIGHSLGGTFILKYLSENNFKIKIKKILLVSPAFEDSDSEVLGNFNFDKNLSNYLKYQKITKIYYSYDDTIVARSDFENIISKLPKTEKQIFRDRFHFVGEDFPEIFEDIKSLHSL